MSDWLLNLPVLWMAVVVFAATYLLAAGVFWVVTRLAVNDRARAFKAVSPGMLPPLSILFALLVGFIAVEVWNNYEKAKVAVATEASALRAVVLLAGNFPEEQKTRIYALIDRHIEVAVNEGWPAMARQSLTLSTLPTALTAALHETLTLKPSRKPPMSALGHKADVPTYQRVGPLSARSGHQPSACRQPLAYEARCL